MFSLVMPLKVGATLVTEADGRDIELIVGGLGVAETEN